MKRIIAITLVLLIILTSTGYAIEAKVEEVTKKGDITKVLSDICQINDKIYFIAQSEEKKYGTESYTNDLYVIEKGLKKNFGEVGKLLNIKEGEVLYYIDMVRVKNKLILVTNARLFTFNFETNRFDYLNWQTDDDMFQSPISYIDLKYKTIGYTYKKYDEIKDELAKDMGWIKDAYASDDFLYLKIDKTYWHDAHLSNTLLRLNPEFPQYRDYIGRQKFYLNNLTINNKDNLYVREVAGYLRVFSLFYYNDKVIKPFYKAGYDFKEDIDKMPITAEDMEFVLVPEKKDLLYRKPLFYGNKLLTQTKEGIMYFDLDKITEDNNKATVLLTETNSISFLDKTFNTNAAYIVNWAVGQDGNIYAVVGESLSDQLHGYERILKITPPSEWEL